MDPVRTAPAGASARGTVAEAALARPAPESRPRSALGALAGRVAYWLPVFAALGLFAQVAFLGLRPALREAQRLASAAEVLEARRDANRAQVQAYELQLVARRDPIYRERQDRLRRAVRSEPPGS
ncbi:MAG: hypothetical protein JNK02_00755 [Planctomycetes bacterium]|nr:hypothetical protein [Planctomycetota bacterium]